ncbi:MAG: Oligoendopeptidase F, plasmid [Chlamydiae bacterium]|nr:Oligoendopeptidase F, plasmid [Chlamydiota bacterium]
MTETAEAIKERMEIPQEDKWNVEALYEDLKTWQAELNQMGRPQKKPHWPELAVFKGRLGEGTQVFKEFLALSLDFDQNLSRLFTYAHMRFDEDLANEEHKKANAIMGTLYHDFSQELAWAEPELLALPDAVIEAYLKDPLLEEYHFYLEKIVRMKSHTLSSDKEELLAMSGKALGTSVTAFSAFNNVDLQFPPATDSEGSQLEVTHAKYSTYLRDRDRVLRKSAFQSLHGSFEGFENTICELFNGHIQKHVFNMRSRGYSSCLDASLFPNQIDTGVYSNLIGTVREHLPVLHRYMKLRKKALGLDELHLYDVYVPIVEEVDMKFEYDAAEKMVIESVAPLGKEYQEILRGGLEQDRWVDRYENLRKRSGAYSTGSYDTMPYILMNFQGAFHDLMTLAHEAGHSMHSFMSHKHQPYQYSHYPIFLAEVASTFNEELMFAHLMKQDLTDLQRAYLINQKIEDIRATFFRQTMFAEFELNVHKLAEQDTPLTPGLLKELYRKLNEEFFGPDVVIDPEIDIEWARIPHFYNNFYVYQYATGISAAHALFEKVTSGGEEARDTYLNFLSSGCSHYPLDLLDQAGVNMRQERPIEATINQFDQLVSQLDNLL